MTFELRKIKGLTIIELLIVLTLISLILLIVIPKIKVNDYELLAQSKKLCNDIRNIRILQMSEGGVYRILLHEKSYRVLKGTIQIKKVDLKENYKLIYSKQEIMFKSNGAPTYGGTTIRLLDLKTNRYCEITIVPASGRILMADTIY
ncbi:prepilin-type N-terminal cleavage/methylation domain-containing protein [Caloranaerobacter sp. DY30410]|uniref:prepilin-type N-terminal cleavage/methylation domain-containing protein n=1 Tax=Caloranaerobacter sp. DY30410 TaxID=3238305 RepID=UPI003D009E9E